MKITPRLILSSLLPTLIDSARYAALIQTRIQALDEKTEAKNIFQAALSDADLSIQTQVEVALLSKFPAIPFFGEEYANSRNTKYFAANNFIDGVEYLVTLDPIDGTRPYLDGLSSYQVILTVCSRDDFEGVLVVYPTSQTYIYALRGEGAYRGTFIDAVEAATKIEQPRFPSAVYVSSEFAEHLPAFEKEFNTVHSSIKYKKNPDATSIGGTIDGKLCGGILKDAQIIDAAAFGFIARELGCVMATLDGSALPRPVDHPSLVLPGFILGDSPATVEKIRRLAFPG